MPRGRPRSDREPPGLAAHARRAGARPHPMTAVMTCEDAVHCAAAHPRVTTRTAAASGARGRSALAARGRAARRGGRAGAGGAGAHVGAGALDVPVVVVLLAVIPAHAAAPARPRSQAGAARGARWCDGSPRRTWRSPWHRPAAGHGAAASLSASRAGDSKAPLRGTAGTALAVCSAHASVARATICPNARYQSSALCARTRDLRMSELSTSVWCAESPLLSTPLPGPAGAPSQAGGRLPSTCIACTRARPRSGCRRASTASATQRSRLPAVCMPAHGPTAVRTGGLRRLPLCTHNLVLSRWWALLARGARAAAPPRSHARQQPVPHAKRPRRPESRLGIRPCMHPHVDRCAARGEGSRAAAHHASLVHSRTLSAGTQAARSPVHLGADAVPCDQLPLNA